MLCLYLYRNCAKTEEQIAKMAADIRTCETDFEKLKEKLKTLESEGIQIMEAWNKTKVGFTILDEPDWETLIENWHKFPG